MLSWLKPAYAKTVSGFMLMLMAAFPAQTQTARAQTPAPISEAKADGPDHCKLGLFVVDLNDLNVQKKTFDANFWLWSLCANEQRQPLKTVEFVNGTRPNGALDQSAMRDGIVWSSRKIEGPFREDWDLRNFPFDRHVLKLTLEEGVDDSRAFQYDVDPASGYDHRINLPGWRVTGFRVVPTARHYNTNFGDPSLPPDAPATYSGMQAEIAIARDSFTGFLKLTSVVYVAATLALLSFLFHLDSGTSFSSRISFLAGALFATVVNMRVASTELGANEGLTMIDLIHISVLMLIITATILTIIADRRLQAGRTASVRRFDLHNLIWCTVLFVAANIGLVTMAAVRG